MYGFIEADFSTLGEEQLKRYRGAYCGLCHSLKKRYGNFSRLTLNYDIVFLSLVLNSMYEPHERHGYGRCLIHPKHPCCWWNTLYTDYAADMSIILAWQKLMDDWLDDKNILAYLGTKLMRRQYEKSATCWPEQCLTVERGLTELRSLEKSCCSEPDVYANCFGQILGKLFDPKADDVWGGSLQKFGTALGKFVYMMDACIDYETDQKRKHFNPLTLLNHGDVSEEEKLTFLKMLIGECTAEFEFLPLIQDVSILRNVLYSGVWTQFAKNKNRKGGHR